MIFGAIELVLIACIVGGVAVSIAIGIVPNWLEFQKFQVSAYSYVPLHYPDLA